MACKTEVAIPMGGFPRDPGEVSLKNGPDMHEALRAPFEQTTLTRRRFVVGAAALATAPRAFGQLAAEKLESYSVIELRQYTLHQGKRDTLISLFEKNFIEPQNAAGAHVIGSFRDLDDPDRFVWIRGFRDMAGRQRALQEFYDNTVWKQEKAAVNATIVDSDNVLLLRAVSPFITTSTATAEKSAEVIYGALIFYLGDVSLTEFADFFARSMAIRFAAWGAAPGVELMTEGMPNNFPRLPVREHDAVFVWLARWESLQSFDRFIAQFQGWTGWRDSAPPAVLPALMRKPEIIKLAPTLRSELK